MNQEKIISKQGLTSKHAKIFYDLLKQANKQQLSFMLQTLKLEKQQRQ